MFQKCLNDKNKKFGKLLYKKIINQNYFFFSAKPNKSINLDSILPDNLIYKVPDYKKNTSFDFPWLIDGAPFLDIKSRLLPDQLFARNKTSSRKDLLDHFFKIFRGVLLASSQFDYEFLKEYCEDELFIKLEKQLKNYEKLNYTIEVVEDMKAENNQRIKPELHFYDSIIVKGLSINRKSNGTKNDYAVCDDINDMGFISFIHKSMSDPGNFLTKNVGEAMLNNSNFKKIIFRAYCMFKCGLKIFLRDPLGNNEFSYSNDYNFNHACVFECEMQELTPLKSYSKVETYTEWIAKHDFGIWKLVDMDNWMKGNNYFLN